MKVILVDGNALLYRSHFAFRGRNLTTSQGEITSAVFGFTNALLHLHKDHDADAILVAFDTPGPNFRHEAYADYKAQRPPMPDEIAAQMPRVKEVVRSMGLPLFEHPGVEADDVLGTLARRGAEAGHQTWIYSGDKDFLPLVRPGVGLLKPATKGGDDQYLDEDAVREKLGVRPAQYLDVLTLMGDKVDNIPGVPGIGEKTAIKLIGEFDSLERLLEHLNDKRVSKRHARLLEEHRDQFPVARNLLTIRDNVDVPVDWDEAAGDPVTPEFLALCRELEFHALAERLGAEGGAGPATAAEARIVEDLEDARRVVADLAGRDTWVVHAFNSSAGELSALCLRTAEDGAVVFPVESSASPDLDLFGGSGGERLPWAQLRDLLAKPAADPGIGKVAHDLKALRRQLAAMDLDLAGASLDTMIASHLVAAERRQHGLEALAREVLGQELPAAATLLDGVDSKDPADAPVERIATFLAGRAEAVASLAEVLGDQLEAEELLPLWTDLERPLSDVLLAMETRGVRLDTDHLRALSEEFHGQVEEMEERIHGLAGEEFNLNSPKQLQHILFDKLGLKPLKKTSTGYSTDESVLSRLAEEHELPRLLLDYRQTSKLLSTYVDALPKLVDPRTGCLHTTYSQAGAATGRLSSADPNLQNIPIRTEAGRRIREAFVPRDDGHRLLAADYSQIELRLMAHLSGDAHLQQAFRDGEDIHARTAALVNDVDLEDVTPELRRAAKAINFGILYGMGARALGQQLGIKQKEAQGFIDAYFERLPSVRTFIDSTIAEAHSARETRTLLGRRRRLPELTSPDKRQQAFGERVAVNTPIQGTAADLIKLAMIRLHARLGEEGHRAHLLLQVHDELILEVATDQAEQVSKVVQEEMEGVWDLEVPLVVEVNLGRTWAEAHA